MSNRSVHADLRRQVRIDKAVHGVSTRQIADASGIDYHRLIKLTNGYAIPRPGELELVIATIIRLGARQ